MAKPRYILRKPVIGDEALIPRGNNKLTALAAFYQKTVYRDTSYPAGDGFGANPIDLIADYKLLYGRVNDNGTPIFLAEDNLMQLQSDDKKTHFVLNFVAEAYEDMRNYIRSGINRVDTKSVYIDIPPARAWTSLHKSYHKYFDDLYTTFAGPYMNTKLNASIVDFDSFMKAWMDYAKNVGVLFPMTRTEYVTSRYVSPSISGLVVEMVEGVHDDDYAKYVGFIRDNNFAFFKNAANRFGFKVDKNAPWRLIADVGSPPMLEYLSKWGVDSVDSFFTTYYFSAVDMEIQTLKRYIWMSYDRFVVQAPGYAEPVECPKAGAMITTWTERPRITEDEFNEKYSDAYWLRVLVYLRAIETHKQWTQKKFERVVKKAQSYKKYVDMHAACDYIDREFRSNVDEIFVTRKDLTEEEAFDILIKNRQRQPNFIF